jgi:hypothetical protein
MVDCATLSEYLKLCRKHGVLSLKVDGMEFSLSPDFTPPKRVSLKAPAEPETSQLSEEEILFYSSVGLPSPDQE